MPGHTLVTSISSYSYDTWKSLDMLQCTAKKTNSCIPLPLYFDVKTKGGIHDFFHKSNFEVNEQNT